jgi:hypothetical protein
MAYLGLNRIDESELLPQLGPCKALLSNMAAVADGKQAIADGPARLQGMSLKTVGRVKGHSSPGAESRPTSASVSLIESATLPIDDHS